MNNKKDTKLLYYTDCPFFAGCENMIANFLNDTSLSEEYEIVFTYNQSVTYDRELHKRVNKTIDSIPIHVYDHYSLYDKIDGLTQNKYLRYLLKLGINLTFVKYIYIIVNTFMLSKVLETTKPDIIHINNGGYPGAYSAYAMVFAAMKNNCRQIVYVVNNIAQGYGEPERWLDYFFDKIVVKNVTYFITGSKFANDILQKRLNISPNKMKNIANGINVRPITETREQVLDRLNIPSDAYVIACIGLFQERKGQIYLLRALKKIKSEYSLKMTFCILEGKGPTEPQLTNYICENNLTENVRMIHDEPNIFNIISAVDCLILPSIANEDFPNVILEAMSLGKPVISTRVAGIPEQIDNMQTGFVVEPKNVDELANAIKFLQNNINYQEKFSNNALIKYNSMYTVGTSIEKYKEVYSSLK